MVPSVHCATGCLQVDLAGSEKWSKQSDMEKAHVSELVHINKVSRLPTPARVRLEVAHVS